MSHLESGSTHSVEMAEEQQHTLVVALRQADDSKKLLDQVHVILTAMVCLSSERLEPDAAFVALAETGVLKERLHRMRSELQKLIL